MANCIIKLVDGKIKLEAGENSSFTQEEFDTWLRLNAQDIIKQLKFKGSDFNPTFAVDLTLINKRVEEFNTFKTDVSNYINSSKVKKVNTSILGNGSDTTVENIISFGTTGLFSLVGKSLEKIDEPVSKWDQEQHIRAIRQEGLDKGLTTKEVEQLVKDYERLSEFRKLDGQIYGALLQDTLNNSTKDLDALSNRTDIKRSLRALGISWNEAVDRIKSVSQDSINEHVRQIKEMFPNYREVHTEFKLVSKSVSTSLLTSLNVALRKSSDDYFRSISGKVNTISGAIDIIIIDNLGKSHTLDIKLSSYSIDDYWPLNGSKDNPKYNEIAAQQMSYYSFARQWGHRFSSVRILPSLIKYNSRGDILGTIKAERCRTFDETTPYRTICKNYFWYDEESSAEVVKESRQDIDELFPGLKLSDKLSTKQFTLDWFKNKFNNKVNDKYRIPIDSRFPIEDYKLTTKNQYLYFDTWEEAEKFLSTIYIPRMNDIFSQNNIELVEDLNKIAKSNSSPTNKISRLENVAANISKDRKTQEFIVNIFKKYVCDGWQIVKDASNDFANYGILIFMKGDTAEIVMLDNGDLFAQYKLGKTQNKNILGNYVNDLALGVDDIRILPAYRGNLLAMHALAIIARNHNDLFTNRGVQAIRAVNLTFRQELTQFNDKLRNNWNDLIFYYNQANPDKVQFKTLGTDSLRSGIFSLVNRANDIARLFLEQNVNFKGHEDHISNFSDESAEEILRYIKNLMAEYQVNSTEDWAKHSDAFEAFTMLSQALLAVRGYIVTMENDCGPYFEGIFINGTKITSPAESPSANVRLLSRIQSVYEKKISDEYKKIVFPWQVAFIEALKESGYDNYTSNERNLFKLCFERDSHGNITEDFVLLPPDKNKDLTNKPKLKKLVNLFLETINEYRIPDEIERERLRLTPGSLYYYVPLTQTSTIQQIKNEGFLETIKKKAVNIFDETKDYMFGDVMSNWELKQYDDISKERIYNNYLDTSEEALDIRMRKLTDEAIELGNDGKHMKHYGVGSFETSLDTIFLRVMAATVKSEISSEFMPLFVGLRAFIAFNGNVSGANMDSIGKAVEEFIKSNVYHKRIIDPSDTTMYNILSLLRSITSKMMLTGNTVTLTREMLTSYIRTAVNNSNDPLMKTAFDLSDYTESVFQIIEQSPKNVNVHSKYMQMNYRYRMANMSEAQLPGQSKTNYFNINNWADDILFLNTTAGDFVHRNGILCAVLKKRGSYDALYLDDTGELQYNPKKDKQYEIFFKYKDSENIIPKELKEEYIIQRDLYEKARLDWNRTYGANIEYGDYLPDALSPTEMEAIRTYADHLFGNFDSDKKATIQKTLLGSFILQFKTFTLQQFMQNVRAKGYTNIVRHFHRTTTDGKKVYWIPSTTQEELEEYGAGRFTTEDKLDGIPVEKIQAVIDTAGGAVNGRFPSIIQSAIDVFNPEVFHENYSSSDVYKANLYMALIDNIGMLIIAALLRLLYGEDTVKEMKTEDWWTRWSYTVLMGVAQDGPINQVIGSLIGNGTPPSIAALQTFFNNSYEVITGEKPVLYGLTNTFGATRQFTGMVLGQR